MSRYLVVGNRTLVGDHLTHAIERRARMGSCEVHIVVPQSEHTGGSDPTETDVAAAQARVDEATANFARVGAARVTHEFAGADPVRAARAALDRDPSFDEVLLSTMPPGPSRWLHLDVPHRLTRAVPIPVLHLVYDDGKTRPKLFG